MSRKAAIIMYHYVRDISMSRYPGIKGLEYDLFLAQIDFLRKQYHMITMEHLIDAIQNGGELPERAALLTFDDGYIDHFVSVYPILKKYGIQGSFFVPAGILAEKKVLDVNKIHLILASAEEKTLLKRVFDYLDRYRNQGYDIPDNESLYQELAVANLYDNKDVIFIKRVLQTKLEEGLRSEISAQLFEECMQLPEEVVSKELYMNLEQIKMMKSDGMYFGLHGYQHDWLGNLPKTDMEQDIRAALSFYEGLIDHRQWVMNYPYGSYNKDVVDFIQSEGCILGLTTERRLVDLDQDKAYTLPRLDTNDYPPKSERYREF